jgi:hypothetical protein
VFQLKQAYLGDYNDMIVGNRQRFAIEWALNDGVQDHRCGRMVTVFEFTVGKSYSA